MTLPLEILGQAATQARGIAIDAVHKCNSGHLGLPLGCAEVGAVLWGSALSYNPAESRWLNRDRFILSAGHGSMFIYTWLHLAGYDLPMSELESFRQLHSKTPGHPEFGETDGVEATTGPLGQGIGNAVGIAVSQKMAEAKYNTADHTIFDAKTFALAGDGCLQEGVARESVAFAGHQKLDNLILMYDSNEVTLDAMADNTQSEDTGAIYAALGWEVFEIDGHNLAAVAEAVDKAKTSDNGQPKIIILKTLIGKGIEEVAGTAGAHGEGGAKFSEGARAKLGLPADKHFYVSNEVYAFFAKRTDELKAAYGEWGSVYSAWKAANADLAAELEAAAAGKRPTAQELLDAIPAFAEDAKIATRAAGGKVLQPLAAKVPNLLSGSADLYGSTKNYMDGVGDFFPASRDGRNFRFGIREHGMGAICNGIAYDGLFIPSGATFLTFADYFRPSIRLAALANLPLFHVLTHDSVGVGEDGPTHQPVELTSALRLIPNLDVIRPADAEETAAAFASAISRTNGPTALILSRQGLPAIPSASIEAKRAGTLKGAYVAKAEDGKLDGILIGSGSEVQHLIEAAGELGGGIRVVSMPSMELFEAQEAAYKESVLPAACTKRIAMEAGATGLWYKYASTVLGIDRFGISAPGDTVMAELGMTGGDVVAAYKAL
jgi:transketolase|tara:strand:+ start:20009 stop:21994 length:1986 start_codon:yes stop_codon:yes gene_type:complete